MEFFIYDNHFLGFIHNILGDLKENWDDNDMKIYEDFSRIMHTESGIIQFPKNSFTKFTVSKAYHTEFKEPVVIVINIRERILRFMTADPVTGAIIVNDTYDGRFFKAVEFFKIIGADFMMSFAGNKPESK